MPLDVLAISGGRADWGLLRPVLAALQADPAFALRIAATGQHLDLSQESLVEIERAGFAVDHKIDIGAVGGSILEVTRAMGQATIKFAELFADAKPELLLVLGDRYEIHAAVSAALMARIPVAHLCGGDITEGAVDDALRHGITKMSHLHFVTNSVAAARVAQLGERKESIFNVGSPGIDQILGVQRLSRDEAFGSLGFVPQTRNILVCFHPVTLQADSQDQCSAMLSALAQLPDTGIILTGSNADPGGLDIDALLQNFASEHEHAVYAKSLGSARFISVLSEVDVMVGNSSSGLYEAPSVKTPTVNIGDRQKGRLRASSVFDCEPQEETILAAIRKALAADVSEVVSPYGDGNAAAQIVSALKSSDIRTLLSKKRFVDFDAQENS
tara:strand:+ start:34667 stop:35824 length:1158 start_codon:yes stop_codon:yes gene_type:complete